MSDPHPTVSRKAVMVVYQPGALSRGQLTAEARRCATITPTDTEGAY